MNFPSHAALEHSNFIAWSEGQGHELDEKKKPSFGESLEEVCPSSPPVITGEGVQMEHKAYLPFSDPQSPLWLHVSLTKFTAFHCLLRLLWSPQGRKTISGSQDPNCAKLLRSQSTVPVIYMQYQLCDLYLGDQEPHWHISSGTAFCTTSPGH